MHQTKTLSNTYAMPDELKGILRRRPSGGWPPQTDSTGGRPDRHVRFAEPVAEEKVESNLDSKLARLGGERSEFSFFLDHSIPNFDESRIISFP